MNVDVYKNPSAIRFIRCLTRIPGTSINAGGAAFTLQGALIRCQSEVIERTFELHELHPKGIFPLGIAAHMDFRSAHAAATHEAIETLCVRQVAADGEFHCIFTFSLFCLSVGVAKTQNGYFCMIRSSLNGTPVGTSSAGVGMFSTLLKTWEEFASLRFFRPRGEALRNYTRINHTFTSEQLRNLKFSFRPNYIYKTQVSALRFHQVERSGRKLVYLTKT